jgi:hypothetical protein
MARSACTRPDLSVPTKPTVGVNFQLSTENRFDELSLPLSSRRCCQRWASPSFQMPPPCHVSVQQQHCHAGRRSPRAKKSPARGSRQRRSGKRRGRQGGVFSEEGWLFSRTRAPPLLLRSRCTLHRVASRRASSTNPLPCHADWHSPPFRTATGTPAQQCTSCGACSRSSVAGRSGSSTATPASCLLTRSTGGLRSTSRASTASTSSALPGTRISSPPPCWPAAACCSVGLIARGACSRSAPASQRFAAVAAQHSSRSSR